MSTLDSKLERVEQAPGDKARCRWKDISRWEPQTVLVTYSTGAFICVWRWVSGRGNESVWEKVSEEEIRNDG